jgi:hypothetical protein
MTHAPSPPVAQGDLIRAASTLAALLADMSASNQAHQQELEQLIRETQTYLHRRAANNARDKACYRIGGALEPNKGHLLDDVALSGFDHLGAFGLLLLLPIALANPGESLSGLLRLLFASEVGASIREWGVWSRLTWLHKLYWQETIGFLQTEKGSDPKQGWRSEKPTARQKHLIREIAHAFDELEPKFARRGDAFEWIKAQGGNPRFHTPPPMPTLPKLPEVA